MNVPTDGEAGNLVGDGEPMPPLVLTLALRLAAMVLRDAGWKT